MSELFIWGRTALFDATYIGSFEEHLSNKSKASVSTTCAYVRDIKQFADFLEERGRKDFSGVTANDIQSYLSSHEENGLTRTTVSRYLTSLKAFFNHMVKEGCFDKSPADGVSLASSSRKSPRLLTGDEIGRLLVQPDGQGAKNFRDKAILETFYATGLRVSELADLELSDVNLVTGLITCRNGNERIIPINAAACKAISNYLSFSRNVYTSSGESALFVTTMGKRMSRQSFWKIIKIYAQKAKIDCEINPRVLRQSFAVHMIENWADLRVLQEMLGHADIASTQAYARAIGKNLKDEYNKAHPRA